jgi:hypothetical protein
MMNKPKRNYMFLNGSEAEADGSLIKFAIPPYAFVNHDPDKKMTIKLISVNWHINIGAANTGGVYNITTQISNRNAYSNNSQVWLASGPFQYQLVGASTHYRYSEPIQVSAELACEPFTEISFAIYPSETPITFTGGEINSSSFVLQIDYE